MLRYSIHVALQTTLHNDKPNTYHNIKMLQNKYHVLGKGTYAYAVHCNEAYRLPNTIANEAKHLS
jgi:hypothetical protein